MDLTTTVERMPVWGETVLAQHFETSFGGKGANQAVAAAKLGAEVVMVTNLGDDTLGDSALKNFESLGIDTRMSAASRTSRPARRRFWSMRSRATIRS